MSNKDKIVEGNYSHLQSILSEKCMNIGCDVSDIISETYIKCDNECDLKYFIKECFTIIKERSRELFYKNKHSIDIYRLEGENQKVCFRCKKLKDINDFGITNVYRYGGSYINSNCRDCAAQISKKWYEKNKSKSLSKSEEYKRKGRESLSDYYIRSLLYKRGFSKDHINNNPAFIEQERSRIIIKRNEKFKFRYKS